MNCARGTGKPEDCLCRRDGLTPSTPSECPYRGLSKRSPEDWSRIIDAPPQVPQEPPR